MELLETSVEPEEDVLRLELHPTSNAISNGISIFVFFMLKISLLER